MHTRQIVLLLLLACPALCFSQPIEPDNYKKYSGACLSSTKFFKPGSFEFDVKASKVSGTIFCAFLTDFEVNPSADNRKHLELGFELIGEKIDSILCVAVLPGGKLFIKRFPLGYNASDNFHRYTMVQEAGAVKWLVDGKTIYQLEAEVSQALLKPMRLYVNFRPAVSHCDEHWGCIRKAGLPTFAYVKNFRYAMNNSTPEIHQILYPVFQKGLKDNLKKHQQKLWQFSSIDLIKGNKPAYPKENLAFGKTGLTLAINREKD